MTTNESIRTSYEYFFIFQIHLFLLNSYLDIQFAHLLTIQILKFVSQYPLQPDINNFSRNWYLFCFFDIQFFRQQEKVGGVGIYFLDTYYVIPKYSYLHFIIN